MKVIIPKIQEAKQARQEFVKNSVPATFQPDGALLEEEKVEFYLAGIDGELTTQPWVDEFGDAIVFSAAQTRPIPVFSPIDVYLVKTSTTNAFGVKLVQ